MKRRVRIFIYSLVAWFVGMVVIVYDFAVSYASSFSDEVKTADWHYYEFSGLKDESKYYKCNSISSIDNLPEYEIEYPSLSQDGFEYTDTFNFVVDHGSGFQFYDFTIISDSEVVFVLDEDIDDPDDCLGVTYEKGSALYLVSQGNFIYRPYQRFYSGSALSYSGLGNKDYQTAVNSRGFNVSNYLGSIPAFSGLYEYKYAVRSGKMKVFDSAGAAYRYFTSGDLSGLLWQGASLEYDGDNIYLDNFQMIVHDSNAYSAYYLEFKYTIPEQLRDAASLKLDIDENFEFNNMVLSGAFNRPRSFSGTNYIDILQNPTGFKLYLKDIDAITKYTGDYISSGFNGRMVLGYGSGVLDLSGLSIAGVGAETITKVTNSKLFLTCYVVANNKYGISYSGSVDFLSGSNDMSSYTPDSSGNYKYNGDLKDQGHYFTDVSTDEAGNITYKYYYYGDDNSKTEVSAKDSASNTVSGGSSIGSIINNITLPDHIFVTVSGSSGGSSSGSEVGNVTIEDDDLSFDSLRESIKDGYGLIDDVDTGTKGDGLIAMLSDLFGYLPAKFVGLIMLGTSSVVGIAVLRMIFKR